MSRFSPIEHALHRRRKARQKQGTVKEAIWHRLERAYLRGEIHAGEVLDRRAIAKVCGTRDICDLTEVLMDLAEHRSPLKLVEIPVGTTGVYWIYEVAGR